MNYQIKIILDMISRKVNDEDFMEFCETKLEELEELDISGESIHPLLEVLERNAQIDFGMPGPIVHYLERFYRNGYEEKLIDSIKRKPTSHTLWMLNRIINGSQAETKKELIGILDSVLQRDDIDKATLDSANEFRHLYL
jgi:hypothetical protein